MSKKSRKNRSRSRAPEASRSDARPAQQNAQPARSKPQVSAVATALQPQNYNYVRSDLIRIAIIAGTLILALIIMTFIPALKS
ncbi:MAG: hypothetical protein PHU70_04820 [Dehalococcoidia bacterium]|nr:hypothetical protein [Dehalococcoidia bacterium]MDD5647798.1 hypothetical protein [Dehalococcoidia bacterium]